MDDDIALLIDDTLSPAAQIRLFAATAIQIRDEVTASNESIVGHPLTAETFVDGAHGASEYNVHLGGQIVYEFPVSVSTDAIRFIAEQLQLLSPVGHDKHSGLYRSSHRLLADGVEVALDGDIPQAREYLFVNQLPYAGKIEQGESPQAASGVYEVTANDAEKLYGSVAMIMFEDVGTSPAIRVTMKS